MAAEAPQQFFYVSPMLLAPGSIIEPGNFGKNILEQTPTQGRNGWPVARELVMEMMRLEYAPHLPSRLNCNFLFTCYQAALEGQEDLGAEVLAPRIYVVEMTDPAQPQCQANFDWMKLVDESRYIASLHAVAKVYWDTAAGRTPLGECLPELLTASPIRILRTASHYSHLFLFPLVRTTARATDSSDPQAPSSEHSDPGQQS